MQTLRLIIQFLKEFRLQEDTGVGSEPKMCVCVCACMRVYDILVTVHAFSFYIVAFQGSLCLICSVTEDDRPHLSCGRTRYTCDSNSAQSVDEFRCLIEASCSKEGWVVKSSCGITLQLSREQQMDRVSPGR